MKESIDSSGYPDHIKQQIRELWFLSHNRSTMNEVITSPSGATIGPANEMLPRILNGDNQVPVDNINSHE